MFVRWQVQGRFSHGEEGARNVALLEEAIA